MTQPFDGIEFSRDGVDPKQWPKLSCSQANQLALEVSDLKLDTNREIFFDGNGQLRSSGNLRFFTGSPSATEKLSLLTNGNVGIGKPEPQAKLEVNGNLKLQQGVAVNEFSNDGTLSNNSDLALPTQKAVKTYVDTEITQVNQTLSTKAALAGDSSQDFQTKNLTVSGNLTTTGNVAIGTTSSPTAKLEVNGTINATSLRAFQSGGSYSSIATFESKNPEPPYVNWLHNRAGGDTVRYGYIQVGDWGDSQQFKFVAENQANFTFVNGNVGMGTTTPTEKLEVAGKIKASQLDVSGTIKAVTFQGDGSALTGKVSTAGDTMTGSLTIYNSLTVSGNVGIGTTNPTYKLDVAGDIKASSIYSKPKLFSFKVEGDFNKFYPVVFFDDNWGDGPTELEINRPDVHTDSQWRGALNSRFIFHSSSWGHGADFCKAEIYYSQIQFIADYQNYFYNPRFIVWLRGGGTTYYWRSKAPITLEDYSAKEKVVELSKEYTLKYPYTAVTYPVKS
ncbi:MAG: hypothetical protein Fur006_37590 [Coleofasciculaceae cyanobacterium]